MGRRFPWTHGIDEAMEESTGPCQGEVFRRYGRPATPFEVRVVEGLIKDRVGDSKDERGISAPPTEKNRPSENQNDFGFEAPLKNFGINLGRVFNTAKLNGASAPVTGDVGVMPAAPMRFVPY